MPDEINEHLKEGASFKIEFMDDNDDYHQLKSHIKDIFDDFLFIEHPVSSEERLPELPENSEINLIFNRNNGILIARCFVLGKKTGENPGIKLRFPHSTEIIERRGLIRVPLKLKIEVLYHLNEDDVEENILLGTTRNISGNGVSFFTPTPLKENANIQCKIHLKKEGIYKPVKVECSFVYSKKVKLKDKICYLSALAFNSISEEDSTRIVKECFKYQINRKHVERYGD